MAGETLVVSILGLPSPKPQDLGERLTGYRVVTSDVSVEPRILHQLGEALDQVSCTQDNEDPRGGNGPGTGAPLYVLEACVVGHSVGNRR